MIDLFEMLVRIGELILGLLKKKAKVNLRKEILIYGEELLCHSHLCTEQLVYISVLSMLRESAGISTVRYTNLNCIVAFY